MKLRNLVLAAALSLPLLAVADDASGSNPFAGFDVGVGLGYTNTNAKLSAASANANSGNGGVAGEVLAGYNYSLDSNWLVGTQVYFDYNSAKSTLDYNSYSVSTKMDQVYGIDALLGYAFNQTAMVFGGLGYAGSKLKLTVDSASNDTSFNGWKGTVGAQQVLSDSFSLRESMSYIAYSSKTNANLDSVSVKPSQYTSLVSLIYTFNV